MTWDLRNADFLFAWSETVLMFIRELAIRNGERSAGFDEMLRITREHHQRGSVRGLRCIFRDVREFAGGLNEREQAELSGVLEQRFGRGAGKFRTPR